VEVTDRSTSDRAQLAALSALAGPPAYDDEPRGRPLRADTAEELAVLARVSDAALGEELMRRRAARASG
jgi:hypothetical protein